MDMLFHQRFSNLKVKGSVSAIFLFVCLMGLLSGVFFTPCVGTSYFTLMRSAAGSPVSIVGLFTSVFLPFLFAAYAVYILKPTLLYAVCFTKLFLFSLCACGIYQAYGTAGWLIQILMQFSDIFMIPVLCWFSLRHIISQFPIRKRERCIIFLIGIIIGIFDYCVVSPFLVKLIDI